MSFPLRSPNFKTLPRRAILNHTSSASQRITPARTFTISSVRALKESDRDKPDLADENEKHKHDALSKQKDGKGHWKPELASDSEEAVAADRHEHNDHSEQGIKELQKRTAEHAEKKHKHGTSMDPGM